MWHFRHFFISFSSPFASCFVTFMSRCCVEFLFCRNFYYPPRHTVSAFLKFFVCEHLVLRNIALSLLFVLFLLSFLLCFCFCFVVGVSPVVLPVPVWCLVPFWCSCVRHFHLWCGETCCFSCAVFDFMVLFSSLGVECWCVSPVFGLGVVVVLWWVCWALLVCCYWCVVLVVCWCSFWLSWLCCSVRDFVGGSCVVSSVLCVSCFCVVLVFCWCVGLFGFFVVALLVFLFLVDPGFCCGFGSWRFSVFVVSKKATWWWLVCGVVPFYCCSIRCWYAIRASLMARFSIMSSLAVPALVHVRL